MLQLDSWSDRPKYFETKRRSGLVNRDGNLSYPIVVEAVSVVF